MKAPSRIVLATDFGMDDPYVGQVKSVLLERAPRTPIIDLTHNLPNYNIQAAAYLLPALVDAFPPDSLFLCIVDPGVGSERQACVAQIEQRWFVGPDNGLFAVLRQRSKKVRWWRIPKPAETIAATFHGRDVFAPVAAQLARGEMTGLDVARLPAQTDWPADLNQIVYIDHYGNLISGYRFKRLPVQAVVSIAGAEIKPARTFSDVKVGEAFYYENANGLLEIAVNQGSAKKLLAARVGDCLDID